MNPDGVSWAVAYEGMTCSNEQHVPGCPCQAGGDPEWRVLVQYVTYGPCHWCKQDTDSSSVNVSLPDGRVVVFCAACYEKGDEGPDITLDMTEDEPNREGWPEFNGSFR